MVPHQSCKANRPLLVHHVARRLEVSRRTVRWWSATGRLPGYRLGVKVWAFRRADVSAFAASRPSRRGRSHAAT